MGQIRNIETGEVVRVADADAVKAVASGAWESVDGVTVQGERGAPGVVDPSQLEVRSQMNPTLRFQTADEQNALERGATLERDYGGAGDKALTFGAGVASGASLGLTDLLGGQEAKLRAEINPGWRTGGQITGAIGGALLGGGATGVAGALRGGLAGAATKIGSNVTGRLAGGALGKGAIATGVGMGVEGGLYGVGQAVGEVALRDPEFTAEAVLEAAGPNVLFGVAGGAGLGAAVGGIGKLAGKLGERSSVISALDMSSPAGKAYATAVATKHGELDELAQRIMARNGVKTETGAAVADMTASDFAEVGRGLRQVHDEMAPIMDMADSAVFAEAEPLTTQFGLADDVDGWVTPKDHLKALDSAHKAVIKHMTDAGTRGAIGVTAISRRLDTARKALASAMRGKIAPDELASRVTAFESSLREAGERYGIDVDNLVNTHFERAAKRAADQAPGFNQPAVLGHEMGATPITDARDALRVARAELDELGPLTPEVLSTPEAEAIIKRYLAATDELKSMMGVQPPKQGIPTMITQQMRADLAAAGHTDDMIAQMTPEQAWSALGNDAIAAGQRSTVLDQLTLAKGGVDRSKWAGAHGGVARESTAKLASWRQAALDAFGGKITPQTVTRVLRDSKEEFLPALAKLDDYYTGIKQAARHSEDAQLLSQFEASLADMAEDLGAKSGLDPKMLTMTQVAAALGVSELPDFEGPVDNLLKYAVMASILGGKARIPAGIKRGLGYNLRRQMFTRGLMGMATSAVGKVPGVTGALGGGVRGATAAASFNVGGRVYDGLMGAAINTAGAESIVARVVAAVAAGTKGIPKALPGLVQLSGAIRTDDDDKEPADDQEAFQLIQNTLSQFIANPQGANMRIYEALRPLSATNAVLADELEVKTMAKYAYAYDKMPKDPGTMMFMGKSLWKPTDRELYTFAAELVGVFAPTEALAGIADGVIPPQAADAIRATNPAMFRHLQAEVMANADAIRENGDFGQLIALGIAFDVPLHPMSDPRYTAWKQEHWAEHTAQMQEAMSNAPNAGAENEPEPLTEAQQMLA